ncbi:MAG: DUF819 family protein [Alphaproteobacteria bacterium]|nr:DUF819 family protein [Alphaproteobacteria bacterium]
MTLAAGTDLLALALMAGCVLAGLWVARQPRLAWFSPPMTALALVVALANSGIMPPSGGLAVPGLLSGPLLAAAIFLLLLQADLRGIMAVGPGLLLAFLVGCVAVAVAALAAARMPAIVQVIGPQAAEVAGMFAGTYTGGAVNFNTLAASFGMDRQGLVFLGATAVDNVWTALWIMACGLAASRIRAKSPTPATLAAPEGRPGNDLSVEALALGTIASIAAVWAGAWAGQQLPLVHPLLWTTVIALVAAQTPLSRLGRVLEPVAILLLYLFIASLGIDVRVADFGDAMGLLAGLAAMVGVILAVHAAVMLAIARWTHIDRGALIVASQAAIGGPPTAIAVAQALDRHDLRLPAVLMGLLGYAIGTWLGLAVTLLASR